MSDTNDPSGPLPESHLVDSSTPPASVGPYTLRPRSLLLLGLIGGFVGAVIALAFSTATPHLHRSEAIIRIAPVNDFQSSLNQRSALVQTSHEKIIPTTTIVETCIVDSNLFSLPSFHNVAKEKVVQDVIDNLLVSVDSPDGYNYRLQYDSFLPNDADSILRNIIATYGKYLESQYSWASEESKILTEQLRSDQEAKLADLNENKSRLSEDTHQLERNRISQKITVEKIEEDQDALRDREELAEQVAAATKGNAETQAEMIWMLRQKGELSKEPAKDLENDVILSRTSKMIDTKIQSLRKKLKSELKVFSELQDQLKRLSSSIRKTAILDQKISQIQSQIAKLPAQHRFETQNPFSFECLQIETEKVPIIPIAIRSATTWGIGGTILGVLFGLLIGCLRAAL